MTNIGEILNECGEQGANGANRPREDERTSNSKLGRIGMMGKWMEPKAQLGKGVKLITSFPLGAF
jgi:hypothetical protein